MGTHSFLFGNKSNQTQKYIEKGTVILDLCNQSEYNAHHLKNAILIPVS